MDQLSAPATTAATAILGVLARKAITIAGTALVAHGLLDQPTADAAAGPLAQYLVGAALIGASTVWSIIRARISHTRWAKVWAILFDDADDQAGAVAPSHA